MGTTEQVNILLVDDHPENLLSLEAILGDLGENLISATSGKEALRYLLSREFAVVLLDVQMPEMDGFETASLIRQRERSQYTPIIFLTAIDKSESHVFKGYSVGAVDYIFKPFEPEILKAKVAVFIDLFKKTRELQRQSELLRKTNRDLAKSNKVMGGLYEEIRLLNADLERRVQQRTRQLEETNRELKSEIAERERIEEELRDSETRYRLISELTSDYAYSFSINDDGGLTSEWMTDAFTRISGYGPNEIDDLGWEYLTHPEDKNRVAEYLQTVIGGASSAIEYRILTKHGQIRWLQNYCQPVWDEDHRHVIRIYGAAQDVTDRKAAETEIRTLNAKLEQRVRERTAELEAANRELESFSYSISHDLRTPLRSIDGFSKALLEDYMSTLDETGRDYLRRVRAASQRMGELIDDMLNLSRVTRNEMRRENVDMSQLAAKIVAELRNSDPDRTVDVHIQKGLTVQGDARLLQVALQNLLDNAWKFTCRTENACIEFGVTETDEKQVYFIRDNGAGFDMQYARKLFNPFQRLHSPDEFPGTGIGLATVQRVIKRHGGTIWTEGAVNQGATFYFTF